MVTIVFSSVVKKLGEMLLIIAKILRKDKGNRGRKFKYKSPFGDLSFPLKCGDLPIAVTHQSIDLVNVFTLTGSRARPSLSWQQLQSFHRSAFQ